MAFGGSSARSRMRGGVPVSRSSTMSLSARSLFSSETALLAVLTVYIVILGLWPLARLFVEALLPAAGGEVLGVLLGQWQSPATQRALINTLESSVLATLLSVAIGTTAAFVLTLTDVRGKAALTFVALLPLLVPSQITALAWIELTGAGSPILGPLGLAPAPGATNPLYSKWGIVLVMGIESSTLVFLAVRAGLRNVPRDLVEAARLGGANPFRVTSAVIMPLAMPAILAGTALAFVTSIGNFGIPAMLGIPGRYTVLTTLIYQRLQGFGPRVLGEVAALALILALLAAAGLVLRALWVRRGGFAADGAGAPLRPFRLGRGRVLVELVLWIAFVCIAVLPLLALLASSLAPALGVPLRLDTVTLANYRFALFEQESTLRAFTNSFVLAFAAACRQRGDRGAARLSHDAAQESRRPRARYPGRCAVRGARHGAGDRDHHRVPAADPVHRHQPLRHPRHHPDRVSGALPGAGAAADRRRHGAGQQEPRRGRAGRRRRRAAAAARGDPAGGGAVGRGRRVADLHDRVQRADGVGAAVVDRPRNAWRRRVLPALRGQFARGRGGRNHFDCRDTGAGHADEPDGAQSAGRSGAVAGVTFEAVSKQFDETRAVESVSLEIADGEFFALLGPSGCGKTTLLRLVAGFEMPDDGIVKLGDTVVGRAGWALPPEKRKIGMVFQSYALWPNMTVAENVAFALARAPRRRGRTRAAGERGAGQGRSRGHGGAAAA